MSVEHLTEFAGKTVVDWVPGDAVPDPETTIVRIHANVWEDGVEGSEILQRLLADPASRNVTGLVFGLQKEQTDNYSNDIVDALVKNREHFRDLTALFLGDIVQEESEISWIDLGDVSPIFEAYPGLEHFGIRGCASDYREPKPLLGVMRMERLKTLIVESGSMDRRVVHDVLRSHLPELEHLELWTGSEYYGANVTVEDFAPLFSDALFPKLRYLGIRNCQIADEVASALTQSPLLERLSVLDLSLGTLSDAGANALLNCEAIRRLEKLDLHFHYCTEEMMQRLQTLGIEVDVSDRQEAELYDDEAEEERYVAVGE